MSLDNLEAGRGLQWRKTRRSIGNGACVEVAVPVSGQVVIRDSTDRSGPVINYPGRSWHLFTAGAREGRFDPGTM
jgi:hypothetical protein